MSHISRYKHKVKDLAVLKSVCETLGFDFIEGKQTVKMFGSQKVSKDVMASVKLPGWKYPVAIKSDGTLEYDHFGSKSNSFDRLGELVQSYNVDAITSGFWMSGLGNDIQTEELEDGSKKLILEY